MSQRYPSDISREQFEKIKPILESRKKKTRPRLIDIYEVFCGVLYVLKSGCQWTKRVSKVGKHILLFSNVE
ncbi:transposase [Wolbachia pipientis]|nr:transposase [Wolbachia pipientis]